jgi:hypothetical protein
MWALTTQEKYNYFKSIVVGHTTQEILELWYKKFGETKNELWVRDIKRKYKFYSGLDTRFKKGEIHYYYTVPIGSEITIGRGNIKIKIAQPDVWVYKHKWVWENANGKMPKDKVLIFLDGNKNNCSLSNLELVDRKEELIMARKELFFNHIKLTKTGILIAKLIVKTKEIK